MGETLNRVLANIRRSGGGQGEAEVLTWALGDKARDFATPLHRIAAGRATIKDVDQIAPALA